MPYEWLFCESSIYADGITLLGPTRSSILSMLNVCDIYARNMDIVFNQAKTHCIFPPAHPNSLTGLPLHFMNTDVVFFLSSCTLLGIMSPAKIVLTEIYHNLYKKLYHRSNEVMPDFKSLSRNVKSQLFSTFCLEAYGSQLCIL